MIIIRFLAALSLAIPLATLSASLATAQSANQMPGMAADMPLAGPQPPAKIVVDPPLAEPLSRGVVFIQYHTENLDVVPVFGPKAEEVSPRIGHLHVAVDGGPSGWANTGGPIIIFGLPPGPHKVDVTLASANHHPLDHSVVEFVVPKPGN
jgi:hypothetical protein